MKRITHTIWLLVLSLALTCCEDYGDPPPEVVLGHSVAGVSLGDSYAKTVALLGNPNSWGLADGEGAWEVYSYYEGRYAGLEFYFKSISGPNPPGPLDIITFWQPYAGKTREGIGLGESRTKVFSAYGPPAESQSLTDGGIRDSYKFQGTPVEFTYDQGGTLEAVSMGPYSPAP